jgi:hypothetical protein
MDVPAALGVLALALAWAIYRLERLASRRRDIDAARSTLIALKQGMLGDPAELGWGDLYFAHGYDDDGAKRRAASDAEAILNGTFNQVFVVPAEPLLVVAASPAAGDLISDETIRAASFGVWKIGVFNQLVRAQTDWNVQHGVEVLDPATSDGRRDSLARAAVGVSHMLHLQGIGEANAQGGWYRRLKRAVDDDLLRLAVERRLLWTRNEWWHVAGDVAAGAAAYGLVVWALSSVAAA